VNPALAELAADPQRAAILLDFDGTLAPIVSHPQDAGPTPGAREVLEALVRRYRLVAIISGRPVADLERFIGVDGVRYEGLYGLPATAPTAQPVRHHVDEAAGAVPGAWVEPKGLTVAVHYRGSEDPARAREVLAEQLGALAGRHRYDLLEGKMVFELAPAGESRKGGAVERLIAETGATAALYAGDDLPDLEAFAALDKLEESGLHTVKIAVGGPETPESLRADADLVASDPTELVDILGSLLSRSSEGRGKNAP
jgi:trehalose 6-phosphate phosphatase